MAKTEKPSAVVDTLEAARLVANATWYNIVTSWIYVPVGMIVILLACFGVDSLIGLSSVSFPASVACMIVLFLALILSEVIFGEKRTKAVARLIDVPGGFSLRWINVFFCPAFVEIPLSSPIGGVEVGKIIAVFLLGYIVVVAFTAYLVRGLQKVLGTSKKGMIERAEELGQPPESIPMTHPTEHAGSISEEVEGSNPQLPSPPPSAGARSQRSSTSSPSSPLTELQAPLRTQDSSRVIGSGGPPEATPALSTQPSMVYQQDPPPMSRPQQWAASCTLHLNALIYTLILIIGLPIYFVTGYAMPAQLALNVLSYYGATALPQNWKKFLHPVMVSSLFTVLGIWILTIVRGTNLESGLKAYQTSTKYTQLLRGNNNPPPGAGDMFSSALDVSIVALALPMFHYRAELKRSYLPILLPNIVLSVASLMAYPPLCTALGIHPTNSLAFPGRSLTLALATPATQNLSGNLSLVAVLAIASGILGVIMGPGLLKWLRIPEDDYITRGITLGSNSAAIATALLLGTDPRAAAFSSLSMSLFGTITVALTSVPPIVSLVKGLAGL